MKKKKSKYAIFTKDKTTGELIGMVEHSLSLGHSKTEVRIFDWESVFYRAPSTWGDPKTHRAERYTDAKAVEKWVQCLEGKCFITRIGSKKCPVNIIENSNKTKYERRNKKFTLK